MTIIGDDCVTSDKIERFAFVVGHRCCLQRQREAHIHKRCECSTNNIGTIMQMTTMIVLRFVSNATPHTSQVVIIEAGKKIEQKKIATKIVLFTMHKHTNKNKNCDDLALLNRIGNQ